MNSDLEAQIAKKKTTDDEFICPICFAEFQKEVTNLTCNHFFCKSCISEYLKEKINNFDVLHINCPYEGCTETYTSIEIRELIDGNLFERYENFMKIKNRDIRIKNCPKIGCTIEHKINYEKDYSECTCGQKICNKCWQEWHNNQTCLQFLNKGITNEKLMSVKYCFMCKSVTGKMSGCNAMTCAACDYAWCWKCGCYIESNRHNCKKIWNPQVPEMMKRNNLKWIYFKLIAILLRNYLFFPILLPFLFTRKVKKLWKIPVFIGGLILGFLLYGFWLGYWILHTICFVILFRVEMREPRWMGKKDIDYRFAQFNMNIACSPGVVMELHFRCSCLEHRKKLQK